MNSLNSYLKNLGYDHFRGITKMISNHSLSSTNIGKRGE